MANEIRANIEVRGEQVAAAKLKKVGDAADKAGDSLDDLNASATEAGESADKAGDGFKKSGDSLGFLDKQVTESTENLKKLVQQLNETGDTSLLKDIRKERRNLSQFKNLAKELVPDVTPAATEAGTSFGSKLVKSASEAIASGNPYVLGSIIGVAQASAPLLGGAIAAAVLGGVGAGGIIGGIALASEDAQVQAAAKQVGQTLLGELQGAAGSFVDPLLDSLSKISGAGLGAKLQPAFDSLSKSIAPLTDGVLGLVDNLLPGLTAAAQGAGPVFDELGRQLPEIGTAISKMFTLMASDPEGAQDAIRALSGAIEFTVTSVGLLVAGLTKTYSTLVDIGQAVGVIDDTEKKIIPRGATEGIRDFGNAADTAAAEITNLKAAVRGLVSEAFSLEASEDAATSAVANLAEQIKEQHEAGEKGAGSLKGNTEAALANRESMRQLSIIYGDLIADYAEAGKSTDGLREKFIKSAVQAGLNKKEVEKYAEELFNLPSSVTTVIQLKAKYSQAVAAILGGASALAGERASGGPVAAGRTYLVGERGPELVTFGASGMVHNAAESRAMMSGTSGGSSGPLQIEVTHRWDGPGGPAGDLGEALARWIRTDVKVRGGGSIVAAYDER